MKFVQSNQFEKLRSNEQMSIHSFLQRLDQAHGNAIQQVILFGSKARGDSQPESDIDILIIVDEENWALRDEISRIAAQLSLAHDVLIGPRVIGEARWRRMKLDRFSLYENVSREGLILSSP